MITDCSKHLLDIELTCAPTHTSC